MTWTLISPFISAGLASLLTYYLSLRTKRDEYLQQNRIASFKAIVSEIIGLKNYCLGMNASYRGHEFSPFQNADGSGLYFREKIANSVALNGVFLTKKSQDLLSDLDGTISLLCNAELQIAAPIGDEDYRTIYEALINAVGVCLDGLYKELGLPK